MLYCIFIILISSAILTATDDGHFAGPSLHKRINKEIRTAECCSKNMRCCNKMPPPPNIEIRAVMARCTNPPTSFQKKRKMHTPIFQGTSERLTDFQGFDEDEPLIQSEVTRCNKKLILTMKIKNEGDTNTRSQFIVIDHVYDPISSMTVRLLNPYVIKIKQEHVSQTYPLRFLDFVNSEAREQVFNKHDGNYSGCYMSGNRPTCGLVKYQGRVIPFSGGFCCSCDAQKNAERQPSPDLSDPKVSPSDPAFLMDNVQAPRPNIKEKFLKEVAKKRHDKRKENNNFYYLKQSVNEGKKMYEDYQSKLRNAVVKGPRDHRVTLDNKTKSLYNNHEKCRDEDDEEQVAFPNKQKHFKHQFKSNKPSMHKLVNPQTIYKAGGLSELQNLISSLKTQNARREQSHNLEQSDGPSIEDEGVDLLESIYSKRQVQSSGVQRRGGQNCADRYTPPHLNPENYHESAHCLRFSPVWYGVYKMDKPIVEQEIVIQIYEKYETESGNVKWKDITGGKRIRLGTFTPSYKDEIPLISLTFNSMYNDEEFCIDHKRMQLLIPEGMKISDLVKFAEAKGGPAEYLLVHADKIVLNGEQCDVAGVGFEAFFKQKNRCSMPRGTCLHHQPKHMWLHDKRMERAGKRGCYYVKFHGKLSKNPIRKNVSNEERFLTLNYYGRYISMIDMEVNADFNAVLRPSSTGVITEVYVDSTCPSRTHITIKLTNGGLLSSKYMVRICDCPLDLKGQLNNLKSELVLIAPQTQHVFKLTVFTKLDVDIFHCSVEALNCKGELVALRRIRIQKMDRCVCTWHCLCACIGSTKGLKCIPMKLDHYHAAGFRGGLPTTVYADHEMTSDDIVRITVYLIIFILITLLLLGLTKALIGLCSLPVAYFGLNLLLDLPKPMKHYYDINIRDRPVVYDQEGWPIHPDKGERIRNIPAAAEFCTNLLFFYTYPTVVLLLVLKRLICPQADFRRYYCEAKCSNKGTQADSAASTASVCCSKVSGTSRKKVSGKCSKSSSDSKDKKKEKGKKISLFG